MDIIITEDNLKIIIISSLAAIPFLYSINNSIDSYVHNHIQVYSQLANLFSSGININLFSDKKELNQLNDNNIFNKPVCIEGVVCIEDKFLLSLNQTECAILVENKIEKSNREGKLVSKTVQVVPWSIGNWEKKNILSNKSILVDSELISYSLKNNNNGIFQGKHKIPNDFIESKELIYSGSTSHKPSWWDIFSSEFITNQYILPTRFACSIVGQLYLNTDGNYLLSAHPDFGFLILKHINFSQSTNICVNIIESLTKFSNTTTKICKYLTYLSATISFCSIVIYLVQEYDLINYIKNLINTNNDTENGSSEEDDDNTTHDNNNNNNNNHNHRNNNRGGGIHTHSTHSTHHNNSSSNNLHRNHSNNGLNFDDIINNIEIGINLDDNFRSLSNTHSNNNNNNNNNNSSNLCVICYDSRRDILIKPCNHFCLCQECSRDLENCPVCRTVIRTTEIIFNV